MHIHTRKLRQAVMVISLLLLISSPLQAQDADQLEWTRIKDKWGQLLFCKRIYKLPHVKPRLYEFDTEQCDKAGKLAQSVIAKYTEQERAQLKNQAELHAARLSQNTSDPYQSVTACREYCRELSDLQDKHDDG